MKSGEFAELIRECPLLVRTTDGREFFVEKPESIVFGDYSAAILVHDNGARRISHIALMNIASVVPHATPSKRKGRRKTS